MPIGSYYATTVHIYYTTLQLGVNGISCHFNLFRHKPLPFLKFYVYIIMTVPVHPTKSAAVFPLAYHILHHKAAECKLHFMSFRQFSSQTPSIFRHGVYNGQRREN